MESNIMVLGANNVGKSAITVRFLTRRFIGEYGDMELTADNPSNFNNSLSCAGSQWTGAYPGSIGCRDSICDKATFSAVARQIQHTRTTKDSLGVEKVSVVIMRNKRDLQHCRVVSGEEGRLLALATHCHFYEVSAAENYHSILTVFHRIKEYKLTVRRPVGIKSIVKSMLAVFTRKRRDECAPEHVTLPQ
uniref:small monomeric GTPase n=1 Tax=Scleropages formosus TaxID=113540 RepID=A0A8C9S660_SCLFO